MPIADSIPSPTWIAQIPREQIAALIIQLSARLLEPVPATTPADESVTWLSVEQAAPKVGRSPRWFYRNAKKLPFVRRLSRKVLLISEQGMKRWIAVQKP